MSNVSIAEVVPGLVVHLDTTQLRALGGSMTNAEAKDGEDRAVQGPHYFLIVATDVTKSICTAVPLFSKPALGNELLDNGRKSGLADKWIGKESYFSKWQHWKIPVVAVAAASSADESIPANRRRYAPDDLAALTAIAAWADKNGAPWRFL